MRIHLIIFVVFFAIGAGAQSQKVTIEFTPSKETFAAATDEYHRLWTSDGNRIIEVLEEVSGMKFLEPIVKANVYEAASSSGSPNTPMNMRASYPEDVKRAALIHELGHRHNFQLKWRPEGLDEHRVLFLYLYDVWEKLYGKEFADKQVDIEKKRKGLYDYESAWNWARAMSKEERASRFKEVRTRNRLR